MKTETPMMNDFEVRPLDRNRVVQAFPLVRLTEPTLSLDDWCDFAEAYLVPGQPPERGVLVVQDGQGTLFGFLVYRVDMDLGHGRTLLVEHLVAQDLLATRRREIATALLQAAAKLAPPLHCRAIHTLVPVNQLPFRQGWMAELLSRQGHHAEQVRLCKPLSPAA
jgi:hypothetical protein